MPFIAKLNNGKEVEFPYATETGMVKAAYRRTRNMPQNTDKEIGDFGLTMIEILLDGNEELLDAYDRLEDDAAFMKKFFGGLDPKA